MKTNPVCCNCKYALDLVNKKCEIGYTQFPVSQAGVDHVILNNGEVCRFIFHSGILPKNKLTTPERVADNTSTHCVQ